MKHDKIDIWVLPVERGLNVAVKNYLYRFLEIMVLMLFFLVVLYGTFGIAINVVHLSLFLSFGLSFFVTAFLGIISSFWLVRKNILQSSVVNVDKSSIKRFLFISNSSGDEIRKEITFLLIRVFYPSKIEIAENVYSKYGSFPEPHLLKKPALSGGLAFGIDSIYSNETFSCECYSKEFFDLIINEMDADKHLEENVSLASVIDDNIDTLINKTKTQCSVSRFRAMTFTMIVRRVICSSVVF
jgi:hypothetical protein